MPLPATRTHGRRPWFRPVVASLVLAFAGCAVRPSPTVHRPVEPVEELPGRLVYPPQPAVLDFKGLQAACRQLDQQITLLYVIGPDADLPAVVGSSDLASLDRAYREFYRYAIQALVLDLREPTGWADLTAALTDLGAVLRAAQFHPADLPQLAKFLDRPHWRDRQLFLLTPDRLPRPLSFANGDDLRTQIRTFLQTRFRQAR